MKRDMNLVRKILLTIEASPHAMVAAQPAIEGYDPETVGYHCSLIIDTGLGTGPSTTLLAGPSPSAIVTKLTRRGHDFLDEWRRESR